MAECNYVTVDEYIREAPEEVRPRLEEIRGVIRSAAQDAREKISWGMATYDYYGNLVHFSFQKKHIGFHPTPSAIIAFQDELAAYHTSKGTVQFPYAMPLPSELIARMVSFRVEEQIRLHEEKEAQKAAKKLAKKAADNQ